MVAPYTADAYDATKPIEEDFAGYMFLELQELKKRITGQVGDKTVSDVGQRTHQLETVTAGLVQLFPHFDKPLTATADAINALTDAVQVGTNGVAMHQELDLLSHAIKNVANPSAGTDAANALHVANAIKLAIDQVHNYVANSYVALTGDQIIAGNKTFSGLTLSKAAIGIEAEAPAGTPKPAMFMEVETSTGHPYLSINRSWQLLNVNPKTHAVVLDAKPLSVEGWINVTGELQENSVRVYSPGNKPTPEDLSAMRMQDGAGLDLNNIQKTGVYHIEAGRGGSGNWPFGSSWGYVVVVKHDNLYLRQDAYSGDGLHEFRVVINGQWKRWIPAYMKRETPVYYGLSVIAGNGWTIQDDEVIIYDMGKTIKINGIIRRDSTHTDPVNPAMMNLSAPFDCEFTPMVWGSNDGRTHAGYFAKQRNSQQISISFESEPDATKNVAWVMVDLTCSIRSVVS